MASRVWFLLVAVDGENYRGTSASAVLLSPTSIVVQFRDAVKAKSPNLLSAVDAADLKVYRNKAAFDGKEEPLEEDSTVLGLGGSMKEALIVLVPHAERGTDTVSQAMAAKEMLYEQPAPSSMARPSTWFKQEYYNMYSVHQPPKAASDPVTLLEPVFGTFVDDCKSSVPNGEECNAALAFMGLMCTNFANEIQRSTAMNTFWTRYLGTPITSIPLSNGTRTMAGGWMHPESRMCLLIQEVKNELGSGGCCPYLQHATCYGQSLPRNDQYLAYRCPAFGIFASGPFFGISGLLFVEGKVLCDPLTDLVSCMPILLYRTQWERFARILKAFKNGFCTLKVRADEIHRETLSFPLDSFPRQDTIGGIRIRYRHRLVEQKLIFVVEVAQGVTGLPANPGKFCVLKFTRVYSSETHQICAKLGFAPALLASERLPGGWHAILMQFVELDGRHVVGAGALQGDLRKMAAGMMRQKLHLLHEQGHAHGDCRPNNWVVVLDKQQMLVKSVCLLDFDHAGQLGAAKYPLLLNTAVDWPPGVECGALMRAEHDMECVGKFQSGWDG